MKFTDLRRELEENLDIVEVKSSNDFINKYLTTTYQDRFKSLKEKYVEYLYSDLMEIELTKDIQKFLSGSYRNANEFAKTCVTTVFKSKDIYGHKVTGWVDSALKCFDNFLLILIQDHLEEEINTNIRVGFERQKYQHLMEKGGDYFKIGVNFDSIYQIRNKFNHVETVDDKTGRRRVVPMSNKKINKNKELMLQHFKEALIILEGQLDLN